MMIDVDNIKLSDLAASSTLDDFNTKCIYDAIDFVLDERHDVIKRKFEKLNRLEEMEDDELNEMLWGISIASYRLTKEEKIKYAKTGLYAKATKGTAQTLKDVCAIKYPGFEVSEWFQHNGPRGTFRIYTEKKIKTKKEYVELLKSINDNKNERSHLEYVNLNQKNIGNIYVGAYKELTSCIVKDKRKQDIELSTTINVTVFKETIGGVSRYEV